MNICFMSASKIVLWFHAFSSPESSKRGMVRAGTAKIHSLALARARRAQRFVRTTWSVFSCFTVVMSCGGTEGGIGSFCGLWCRVLSYAPFLSLEAHCLIWIRGDLPPNSSQCFGSTCPELTASPSLFKPTLTILPKMCAVISWDN